MQTLYTVFTRATVVETARELIRAESEQDAIDGNGELVAVLDVKRESAFVLGRSSRKPTPGEIEDGIEPPPAAAVLDDVLASLRLLAADPDVDDGVAGRIGGIIRAANALTEPAHLCECDRLAA